MRRGTHAVGTALGAVVLASGLRGQRGIRFARSQSTYSIRSAQRPGRSSNHIIFVCGLYVFDRRGCADRRASCDSRQFKRTWFQSFKADVRRDRLLQM